MKDILDQQIDVLAAGYKVMGEALRQQDVRFSDLLDQLGEQPMPGEARREAIARLEALPDSELERIMRRNGKLGGGHGKG
ncbi:hypothetical protein [Caballeronia sp. LZ001]|uniref:hypothetical protein n=1 Tax=Caballeronia sp. LZ001 TaxID=3038553 RepID=UPI0028651155|nr:hypothetical protein [Caballeronia sp. LZ001]MDR5801596.1 hypothetical protein [Caballeronia sp. LZ001]